MEHLTFNVGRSRARDWVAGGDRKHGRSAERPTSPAARPTDRLRVVKRGVAAARERYDADYLWMLAFTALVFFRPQDLVPPLQLLHLAELTAIGGLAAMATRRLKAGLPVVKINPEVIGVMALGGVIVATIPFSIWPSGSFEVFSDIYVKVILIFALMIGTLRSPRRLRQVTWIMMIASAYIASRAVFDYARGVNLVEGGRVRGAVGGMFENPNDLALNLVTFLAPTLIIVFHERRAAPRVFASMLGVVMFAAIICTKSRGGFLGLLAMAAVVAVCTVRVKPGVIAVAGLCCALAIPVLPQSFWGRMDSIMNGEEDPTGSREARLRLMTQGLQVFAENPITGVGAGQFKNYNDPSISLEKWRVTHNVWLQVATELGVFGLGIFAFLVYRAYAACLRTSRLLRPARKRKQPRPELALSDRDRQLVDLNAKGMLAAIVGWSVCSFFASVAFNWTFYYVLALAVAGCEIVQEARNRQTTSVTSSAPAPQLVRAHA